MLKKSILSVAVAGALTGFAGVASAALVQNGATGAAVGNILVIPYFTVQNGNATLINLTNTDTANGKAVKVRFRGGRDSDDIFDFQVFMSPGDVWTAKISQHADGVAMLETADNSCTLPSKANLNGQKFVTTRLAGATQADKNAGTLEGYVEIFSMADIPVPVAGIGPWTKSYSAMTATEKAETLYGTIKHSANVAACSETILTGIETKGRSATIAANDGRGWYGARGYLAPDNADVATSLSQSEIDAAAELAPPTGGLMGNWTIINVPNTTTFTGEAVAIAATNQTRVVYSRQTSDAVTAKVDLAAGAFGGVVDGAGLTAAIAASDDFPNINTTYDAVLLSTGFNGVQTAEYDFPDLSTPYEVGTTNAGVQAYALSASIAHNTLVNEFLLDTTISAKTDWLVSQPTRRYLVAGRGNAANGVVDATSGILTAYKAATTLADNATDSNSAMNDVVYTADAGVVADAKLGAEGYYAGVTTYAADGRSSCVNIGAYSVYNREETTTVTSNVVISPSTVSQVSLCGEVTVLSLNNLSSNTGAVGANLVVQPLSIGYSEGWASVNLNYTGHIVGLPAVGYAFVKAVNPAVSAGVSGTFGGTWAHRW
jgi:hypothetical protein